MPQTRNEEIRFYRMAYDKDVVVGRAIDIHTERAVSGMQLDPPQCICEDYSNRILDFYQRLVDDTNLFGTLEDAVREYFMVGEAFIYLEEPDGVHLAPPPSVKLITKWGQRVYSSLPKWLRSRISTLVFPDNNPLYDGFEYPGLIAPEQVTMDTTPSTSTSLYFTPTESQKREYLSDPETPSDVLESIKTYGRIRLNEDPFVGSYTIHFARKKSDYEIYGRSPLQKCMRTIIYRAKLCQAQSEYYATAMHPNPDLDLTKEWEHTNKDLAIGLGLTPEVILGDGGVESAVQLRIMDESWVRVQEVIAHLIESEIFEPLARKKGFYEVASGEARYLYPKVSFSKVK